MMMSSGGRVRGVGAAVFCIGLIVCLAGPSPAGNGADAESAAGGSPGGGANSIEHLASRLEERRDAAPVGAQASAVTGDLYVMPARDPAGDVVYGADDIAHVISHPMGDALKAGPVEVPVDAAKADDPRLLELASAATDVADDASGVTEPAAAANESAAGGEALTEEQWRGEAAEQGDERPAERFVEAVRSEALVPPAPAEPQQALVAEESMPEPIVVAQADAESVSQGAASHEEHVVGGRAGMFEGAPRLAENPDAPSTFEKLGGKDGIMRVLAGKSLVIDLHRTAKRVSVANPEVAEVLVISPRQVMINGLANGETSIIIWDTEGNYTMNSLVVGDQLQDQVMLEVTVAEINRTAAERHGVDVRAMGGQFGTITQYGNAAPTSGTFPPREGEPLFPVGLDSGISWAVVDFKNDIGAFFEQIQREDLGRILAEPKLLARSGKEANFLSGGEIPIVITQNEDTTIEFKEFGTKIFFIPEVREDGTIDLKVKSEVSEPDFSNGVELFGFRVPAFVTRRVDTDVTLRNAESLVIAGLIKETKQELESKMPFMGDIPYLGYLFRSTEFEKNLLELVIVVRPRIVAPIAEGASIPLPTDRGPLTRDEVKTKAEKEKVSRPRPY